MKEEIPQIGTGDSINAADFQDERSLIVRELAECGPFALFGIAGEAICTMCNTSGFGVSDGWLSDPANHEPSCLWRRSRGLYPDAGVTR